MINDFQSMLSLVCIFVQFAQIHHLHHLIHNNHEFYWMIPLFSNTLEWFGFLQLLSVSIDKKKKFHFQSNHILFSQQTVKKEIVNNFLVKLSLICFCSLWIAVTLFLAHTTQPNEMIQCCHWCEHNRPLCFFSFFSSSFDSSRA